jgi:ATP-dependent Clp protease ATP-binding subunit ClpA
MGADSPTSFEQLIKHVHDRTAGEDATALLRASVAVSAEHAATADRLLDHFVALARSAGLSWTDIGTQLGVSRQAARQRFADRQTVSVLPFAARTAPRLQACLDSAGEHARAEGAKEIGTEHLLAGLMAEGVAAAILENLQVRPEAISTSSHRLFGPRTGPAAAEIPPMSSEARCALDAAARNVAASDSDSPAPEVRTEHLLAVLVLDPGSRARRVLNDIGVDIAAIKRELEYYLTFSPSKPARWWKRRPSAQHGCSFCGRAITTGQLVHGPGVAICSACVALAGDILEDRQPSP